MTTTPLVLSEAKETGNFSEDRFVCLSLFLNALTLCKIPELALWWWVDLRSPCDLCWTSSKEE